MVGKVNIKFLKIFLKMENHWIFSAFHLQNFIWDTGHLLSRMYLLIRNIFRQNCQHHYTHRFLSLSFQVPQLLSSRLYSPMFSDREKKAQSCKILISKIQQVIFLTFSSYSITNLPNYLNFFDLAYFRKPLEK